MAGLTDAEVLAELQPDECDLWADRKYESKWILRHLAAARRETRELRRVNEGQYANLQWLFEANQADCDRLRAVTQERDAVLAATDDCCRGHAEKALLLTRRDWLVEHCGMSREEATEAVRNETRGGA